MGGFAEVMDPRRSPSALTSLGAVSPAWNNGIEVRGLYFSQTILRASNEFIIPFM